MKLSKETKIFCCVFLAFLESTSNSECFKGKMSLISQVFLELVSPKHVLT